MAIWGSARQVETSSRQFMRENNSNTVQQIIPKTSHTDIDSGKPLSH